MTERLPYPILPLQRTEPLSSFKEKTLVLVVGGRGIALAVALRFRQLGARVAVTTRNLATYDHNAVPDDVDVFELDYTRRGDEVGSPKSFVTRYVMHYGRVWDIRHDGAMTVYAGDPLDYSEEQLETVYRMLFIGPAMLEKWFFRYADEERESSGEQRHFTTVYGLSTAAFTSPPFFQPIYNMRHTALFKQIVARNASQKRPEMLYLGVACTFTDTQWYEQAVNPSAAAGDKAQQQYMQITTKMTPQIGVPTETIAEAVAQAVLLRTELNEETIFVVPDKGGAASQAGSAYLVKIACEESGKQYAQDYAAFAKNSFGIDLTLH